MADFLASIDAGNLTLAAIIDRMVEKSTETLKSLNIDQGHKGLTFVLAGFSQGPFIAQISNFEDEKMQRLTRVDQQFHLSVLRMNPAASAKPEKSFGWMV